MNYRIQVKYEKTDFTEEQINTFKNKIATNTKPEERTIGTIFIFQGITFQVAAIVNNFDQELKSVYIEQLTTHNRIIKPN